MRENLTSGLMGYAAESLARLRSPSVDNASSRQLSVCRTVHLTQEFLAVTDLGGHGLEGLTELLR
jgi:hypothetical protein